MNRAEYEIVINRLMAVESRCELLESELKALKAEPLDKMVAAEAERVTKKAERRAGTF